MTQMFTSRGIQLLPPAVADRIAAGEVIERPASVVKELVENALDAGATRVDVEVREGGRWLRVADNGGGIPAAELPLAFQRFATSKLRDIDELWQLESMGFRGEALASIASVARVEAFSRPADQPAGAAMRLEGGAILASRAGGGPPGTVIEVADLFFNTPARLRFMRQPATEFGHVAELVGALALAWPEVAFSLAHEGREVFATQGTGRLRDAARAIYGRELAHDLIEVKHRNQFGHVTGLIATPVQARADRNRQLLFINRRWVRLPLLGKLLDEVYGDLLPRSRHPAAFLALDLPPDRVDVNVHPTKREVRLQNSQGIFALLHEGLRECLYKGLPAQPAIQLRDVPAAQELPGGPVSVAPPSSGPSLPAAVREERIDYEPAVRLPQPALPPSPQSSVPSPAPATLLPQLTRLRPIGQFAQTYIMAEGPEGLYMIDQHAAHERLRYERLLAQGAAPPSQPLLAPLLLNFDPVEMGLVDECQQALAATGFLIEPFGERTVRVREAPHDLPMAAIERSVRGFLQDIQEGGTLGKVDRLEWLRKSIACQGAVQAGRPLDPSELQKLLADWARTSRPQTCPHGRPAFQVWAREDVDKRFWR